MLTWSGPHSVLPNRPLQWVCRTLVTYVVLASSTMAFAVILAASTYSGSFRIFLTGCAFCILTLIIMVWSYRLCIWIYRIIEGGQDEHRTFLSVGTVPTLHLLTGFTAIGLILIMTEHFRLSHALTVSSELLSAMDQSLINLGFFGISR
jgi:hypothetical protein